MMPITRVFYIFFTLILSVGASTENYQRPSTYMVNYTVCGDQASPLLRNQDNTESERIQNNIQRDSNAVWRDQHLRETDARMGVYRREWDENQCCECETKLQGDCIIRLTYLVNWANWIIPGFLILDKAFLMAIMEFMQKRIFKRIFNGNYLHTDESDSPIKFNSIFPKLIYRITNFIMMYTKDYCFFRGNMVSFIMMFTNIGLLVHQQSMIKNGGEMWNEYTAEKLLPIPINQKIVVIAFPFFGDILRWHDPDEDMRDVFEPKCCSIGCFSFAALTLANDILPAFCKSNFFIPLLILSFFQHSDWQSMWLLLYANIAAISLFQNDVIDGIQITVMVLSLVIKFIWADWSKKKFFSIMPSIIVGQ